MLNDSNKGNVYKSLELYSKFPGVSPQYVDKMMHEIPSALSVKRETFILERCAGKRVVNFGSTGDLHHLHQRISAVAQSNFGVDKDGNPDLRVDLDDDNYSLFHMPESDVYVCGELLEHLLNPGNFLRKLCLAMRKEGAECCELIITAPNAMSAQMNPAIGKKIYECVNIDHVCWYSYRTLKTLIERCGFELDQFYWYGGAPITAEGLIFVVH